MSLCSRFYPPFECLTLFGFLPPPRIFTHEFYSFSPLQTELDGVKARELHCDLGCGGTVGASELEYVNILGPVTIRVRDMAEGVRNMAV